MPPDPRVEFRGPLDWSNRHESVSARVARLYDLRNALTPGNQSTVDAYNAMTAAIQKLVGQAVDAGVGLRAAGAGWSLSDVGATDGWLLNTQPLDFTFRLTPNVVADDLGARASSFRFVQCGMGIAQLGAVLRKDGQSLRTSGASNGQTLAGAVSTGTHGAALDVGAIQDSVHGLHIVSGASRSVFLERKSRPVVTERFTRALGAELLRDDALFDAALVSFGSFGVIHGLLIETEPLFLLEAHRKRIPLAEPLLRAIGELTFEAPELPRPGERPYHFQVVVNPHDTARGAYVTIMYKRPYRDDYARVTQGPGRFGAGDDAPAFIGLVTDAVPGTIPALTNEVLARSYGEYGGQEGTLAEIFSNTEIRGQVFSAAVGVSLPRAREALEAVLAEHAESGPAAVVFALRTVRGSRATLACTHFATTCVLEIDGVQSERTRAFCDRVWARLDRLGMPYTFHWGKQNKLDATRVRARYGERVDRWLAARRRLLGPPERQVFSNVFLTRLDLHR